MKIQPPTLQERVTGLSKNLPLPRQRSVPAGSPLRPCLWSVRCLPPCLPTSPGRSSGCQEPKALTHQAGKLQNERKGGRRVQPTLQAGDAMSKQLGSCASLKVNHPALRTGSRWGGGVARGCDARSKKNSTKTILRICTELKLE